MTLNRVVAWLAGVVRNRVMGAALVATSSAGRHIERTGSLVNSNFLDSMWLETGFMDEA
jgi:hypothetical protein